MRVGRCSQIIGAVTLLLFFCSFAEAKRSIYLPSISSDVFIQGYDSASTPKYVCKMRGVLGELVQGSGIVRTKKVSGAGVGLVVSLRNLSKTTQTVSIVFERANFYTGGNILVENGLPDKQLFQDSISSTGWTTKFTMQPYQALTIQYQFGCQGYTGASNCWLHQYAITAGATVVKSDQTLFGTLGINAVGPAAEKQFICYAMVTSINMHLDIEENSGAIIGSVATNDVTSIGPSATNQINNSTNFEINSGRPF